MIQLKRLPKPAELTDNLVKELTETFKSTGERVWNKAFITDNLLKMSDFKCCYCQCNINEESKYMEVEHFLPKRLYPDYVVEWENLLPSCKFCNGHKSEHDTKIEPIINPVIDNPKDHLQLKLYWFSPKTNLGELTRAVLLLNDSRLSNPRYELCIGIQNNMVALFENTQDYFSGLKNTTRQKNKIVANLRAIMSEGKPQADYSATAATVILTDDNFPKIKSLFQQANMWTAEFEDLEKILQKASLT